ncbi:MAG: flagellin lysine-N-methylase [Lachnospiraceae bacterium]|nr:flagellin lysine-N-methylase [Lachnospiraceae bacterium]
MARIIRERPSYYSEFRCTGNTTCIDNCCVLWDLPIDDATAGYYLSLEGEFGDYVRSNMFQNEEGKWYAKLKEGNRCSFCTEDNLCNIRLHLGEHAQVLLCEVYPRERDIKVGNYRLDRMLIACSEVASLIYKDEREKLEFIRWEEESECEEEADGEKLSDCKKSDGEESDELIKKTAELLAFRDGLVEGIQTGAFDASVFGAYEPIGELERFFNEALYFDGHEPTETIMRETRELLPEAENLRKKFYDAVPQAKVWMRKSAAYFAHRNLLDAMQDGSIHGPLVSVFRSAHILELICLSRFKSKGRFDVDDMIESAHTFGLTFELSMHNIELMKKTSETDIKDDSCLKENSEMRPFLYP